MGESTNGSSAPKGDLDFSFFENIGNLVVHRRAAMEFDEAAA
jgi:hypothetical protein